MRPQLISPNLDFVVVSHRHGDHTSGLNHFCERQPERADLCAEGELRCIRRGTSSRNVLQMDVMEISLTIVGLGTTVAMGATIKSLAEAGQPHVCAMDGEDRCTYAAGISV